MTTSISNKPSVILFSPKPNPSLLYHLVAFSNCKQQSFGFVSLTDSSSEPLRKRFRVNSKEPTVLIFKDDVAVPDVVVMVTSWSWQALLYAFLINLKISHLLLTKVEMPGLITWVSYWKSKYQCLFFFHISAFKKKNISWNLVMKRFQMVSNMIWIFW